MAELTFGSQDIRDRSAIFLDLVRGFWEPADHRGTDIIVPSLAGRIARSRVPDVRSILLVGRVVGTDAADFHGNMEDLFAAFAPSGIVTPDTLTVDDGYLGVGASSYTIEARYLNATITEVQAGPTFARLTVELESLVPDWTEGS